MQKLSPVHIVASVVIAVAGTAAHAQTAKPVAKNVATKAATTPAPDASGSRRATPSQMSAPSVGTNPPANTRTSSSAGESGSAVTLSNTSNTDARNEQTLKATEGTRSSGSTASGASASAGTSGTAATGATTASSGPRATGSSSVNSTGASASAGSGTTTGTTDGAATTAVAAPLLLNSIVGAGGEGDRVFDDRDATAGSQTNAVTVDRLGATVILDPVAADTARAGASLNRVIRQSELERKKIGRNGQLLNSIAPRTNADRSKEMPDDGPTPALKGLMSR